MKFIVSSSTLLKQLQAISGVLNSNNTLPILDNFLFELNKTDLTVMSSDLETTMSAKLHVESKESGNIAIPAKMLLDALKNFSDQPLSFSVDTKKSSIEITYDNGKSKLTGHNGDEYPKVPSLEAPSTFEINGMALSAAISKTLFATGNDELRPVMSGVFFQLGTEEVTFVATDAHKLVRYRRTDSKSTTETAFIAPKKPLNLLKNILATADTTVKIEYNNTNAHFAFGNISMICRLIDGKYPNYNAVIPKENPNKLIVSRTAFLSSIRRVAIFSNKSTHQIRLKISGSELNISAEDLDYSNEANERLTCQYEGDDMEIGFNSKFLMEMLTNIDSDEITIEMSAPNRAGILKPAINDSKEEDILMLVMPVMLNN